MSTSLRPHGLSTYFSRSEYWSGWPFPSLEHFPNPGIEPGLRHCRWILYQLSYQGSPRYNGIAHYNRVQYNINLTLGKKRFCVTRYLEGLEMNLHSFSPVPVLSNSEHSFQATENELDFSISVPEESQHVQTPRRAEGFPCVEMTTKITSFVQDPNQHRLKQI